MGTYRTVQQQSGASLIVALVFLVILTTLGLSAMETSTYEVKIAQSVKSQMQAFNAAEDELLKGEAEVLNTHTSGGKGGFNKNFDSSDNDELFIGELAGSISNTVDYKSLLQSKSYTIEYLGTITPEGNSIGIGSAAADKRYLFRITAYGEGAQGGVTITQSYFVTQD